MTVSILCGIKLSPGQILLAEGGYVTPEACPDTNHRPRRAGKKLADVCSAGQPGSPGPTFGFYQVTRMSLEVPPAAGT